MTSDRNFRTLPVLRLGDRPSFGLTVLIAGIAVVLASVPCLAKDSVPSRAPAGIILAQDDSGVEKSVQPLFSEEELRESSQYLEQSLSTEEVPNLKIGWQVNDAFGSYTLATENNRATVLFFHSPYCIFCKNLLVNMKCPSVNRFAGRLMFGVSIEELDPGAAQLAEALGVVRFPTIVILAPSTERIYVAGRIEGEVPDAEVERVLLAAMKDLEGFDASTMLSAADVATLTAEREISHPDPQPEQCALAQ